MNKQEAIKRIQVLEKELAELKKIIGVPEERFLQLVENVEIRRDFKEFPDSIFFFNGDKFLAEYNARFPEKIFISLEIWGVFGSEYKMQYADIQAFIREQVEKHFKMKVSEPSAPGIWRLVRVEKHFKMKVSEPTAPLDRQQRKVEKHFKRKVSEH